MQDLFLQLFNKDLNDDGSRNMLMNINRDHPYFSAAYFYLLKKTVTTEAGYDKITAKTALHFNNPFLLNYRLAEVVENKMVQEVSDIPEVQKVEPVQQVIETGNSPVIENIQPTEEIQQVDEVDKSESTKDELVFEPLFASDYFASQGIKLSEEVQTGDKLGKQLKSFTEWLKSMKKVHESKAPEGNVQIDLAVQNLAEKSNQEDDILTESMADAYLQQGKHKKARETLEKLSLLNPAKSAYFAAKIESIHSGQ